MRNIISDAYPAGNSVGITHAHRLRAESTPPPANPAARAFARLVAASECRGDVRAGKAALAELRATGYSVALTRPRGEGGGR